MQYTTAAQCVFFVAGLDGPTAAHEQVHANVW